MSHLYNSNNVIKFAHSKINKVHGNGLLIGWNQSHNKGNDMGRHYSDYGLSANRGRRVLFVCLLGDIQ